MNIQTLFPSPVQDTFNQMYQWYLSFRFNPANIGNSPQANTVTINATSGIATFTDDVGPAGATVFKINTNALSSINDKVNPELTYDLNQIGTTGFPTIGSKIISSLGGGNYEIAITVVNSSASPTNRDIIISFQKS